MLYITILRWLSLHSAHARSIMCIRRTLSSLFRTFIYHSIPIHLFQTSTTNYAVFIYICCCCCCCVPTSSAKSVSTSSSSRYIIYDDDRRRSLSTAVTTIIYIYILLYRVFHMHRYCCTYYTCSVFCRKTITLYGIRRFAVIQQLFWISRWVPREKESCTGS